MNDMNEPMAEATPSASSVEEVQNEVPRTDLTLFAEKIGALKDGSLRSLWDRNAR